jgi:hypothetical protein
MSNLADRLAGLDPAAQAKLAEEHAPGASTEELIQVLVDVPIGEVAGFHVFDELTYRGPGPVDAIIRAMLADPVSRIRTLGEALVVLYQREPSIRHRVAAALIDAVSAALDAGGGSLGAAVGIQLLADCANIAGPLPEAIPVATRLLAIAATEEVPYLVATGAARDLAGKRRD